MSEVDKLFAKKNIYTNHNGVSTFNFYLHIRLLAATFKFYFILIKLHFQSPVYFPSSRIISKVLLRSEQTWK